MNLKTKITNSWIYKYRGGILLVICLVLTYFVIKTPRTIYSTISTENPLALKEVTRLKDQNDKLYAKINQIVLDDVTTKKYTDSLAKALKIEKKNIKSVERVVTRDSIIYRDISPKPILKNKEIVAYSVEFKDPWVYIKAVAGRDTGNILYSSKDTLTRVVTEENHLFRPTEHFVFLGNTNPHNQVTEGASFSIKEKKTWLTIGPYIGYDPFVRKLSLGVGAQLPILQFKR